MRRFKQNEVKEIANVLQNDGCISIATDTVYGVCCRYDHESAQEKLRDVKKRPATKAFPIMCADEEQIKSICEVDARSEKLIRAFMPGPVTFILQKKESVPFYVNGGMETLAIRMATSDLLKDIICELGCPVFMTSANQSGEEVCTNLDEIEKHCPLLDGMVESSVSFGEASTIIDCTKKEISILRQGPVTLEQIQEVLGK